MGSISELHVFVFEPHVGRLFYFSQDNQSVDTRLPQFPTPMPADRGMSPESGQRGTSGVCMSSRQQGRSACQGAGHRNERASRIEWRNISFHKFTIKMSRHARATYELVQNLRFYFQCARTTVREIDHQDLSIFSCHDPSGFWKIFHNLVVSLKGLLLP